MSDLAQKNGNQTGKVAAEGKGGILSGLSKLLFGAAPLLYAIPIMLVMAAAFFLHMRRDGIFTCPADKYGGNHYLGYCVSTAYGDYDHGAVWFGLEPGVRETAAKADVLFLGSSRAAFGFAGPSLGLWFARQDRDFYVLGFSHFENMTFTGPLLKGLQPKARAYVINADGFFSDKETGPGGEVMHSPDARRRYLTKKAWQDVHLYICSRIPRACGQAVAFYRQRDTGQWIHTGVEGAIAADNDKVLPLDPEKVAAAKPLGEKFISELGVPRECVILTYIPPRESEKATAAAIAESLGMTFISPDVPGLRTWDQSHLDPASAEAFVAAFMQEAGPRLQACIGSEGPLQPEVATP